MTVKAHHAHHRARAHRRHRPRHRYGRVQTVESTSYSACDSGSITAIGSRARWGIVAVPVAGLYGSLPMGSLIRTLSPHSINGRRVFRVEDHIGWGSQLDIYAPWCSWATQWGRRTVRYRVIRDGWKWGAG